jgi:membrane-bound lytic murein transglycosylase D
MDKMTIPQSENVVPPTLNITIVKGKAEKEQYVFENSFNIGRGEDCQIIFDEEIVSRVHAEVKMQKNGQWWLEDLNSTNGTFLNGQKIDTVQLQPAMKIEFGLDGPLMLFDFALQQTESNTNHSVTHYVEHYFHEGQNEAEAGEHTRMVREAYERVHKKYASKYYVIIGLAVFLFVIAGGYAIYQHKKAAEQKNLAEEIFYNMKALELQLGRLQQSISLTNDTKAQEQIRQYNTAKADMEKNYDNFVKELGIYKDMDESEILIVKMARLFGECEINVPPEFVNEVKKYIRNWQSTKRISRAIKRARDQGFPELIVEKMLARHLPPQFFFLALQESSFNSKIVGPQTRYGYAKGIWQFIPQTAVKYGLETGPLVEVNQYDPRDDRFDMEKATAAAAAYISDIYNTEAQASGLLVIASYNWGEHNVRNLIAKLPANPKERNFWKLLDKYKAKIPNETYKYVFYIFSAAVIGENPRLFGFDFSNPIKKVVEDITY